MLQTFVAGLYSTEIRKHLLEEKKLNFTHAYELAMMQFEGHKEASLCERPVTSKSLKPMVASTSAYEVRLDSDEDMDLIAAAVPPLVCCFCGRAGCSDRKRCKAKSSICFRYLERGHWARTSNNKMVEMT